ncbi:MAG: hypothetical protein HYT15_02825 [Candidatus Magasanikbacteria bacterium]|nr:hypothetical protein [Candidatus Magasanikbacteria bacterium]
MQNQIDEEKPVEDVAAAVDELMSDFNLDEEQAAKAVRLLDEGESEEDAVADALDS